MLRRFRYHIALFFAVIGPVSSRPSSTMTRARNGAYLPLWTLLPITVLLIVTQEMSSR